MTAILLDADEVIKEAGNSANFRIDQKKTKERVSAKEKEITKYNQMLVSLYEDYRCLLYTSEPAAPRKTH